MSTSYGYSYVPDQVIQSENVDLRALFLRYLRHWKWFVASLALAMVAAHVYFSYQQPTYLVQSSLLIKDEKKGISEENVLKELDIFAPKKVVENEIEILKSYTLMNRVVNRLNLNTMYYHTTTWGDRELYGNVPIRLVVERAMPSLYKEKLEVRFVNTKTVQINDHSYPVNQSLDTPYGRLRVFAVKPYELAKEPILVKVVPPAAVINSYLARLTVEPTSKQSTVLAITLEDAVPQKGEAILNQLVDEYNHAAITDKNKAASNTLNFIEDRLRLISGELTTVEKEVENYKSSQGITDLSNESAMFLGKVKETDTQLSQVDLQLGTLQDLEKYVHGQANSRGIAPATLGLSDPIMVGLVSKLAELELQRDHLSRTTSEDNPLMQTLQSQITVTKGNLSDNIRTMKAMLTSSRQQLLRTNQGVEQLIRTVPQKERALLNITRQQVIKNELYTYLLKKREETALSFAATVADSRTIDSARSNSDPVKPVKRNIFLLFGMLGLCLPVGLIAARDAINNRVIRRSDVEELTQAPIIAEVVDSKQASPLVIAPRSQSVIAEQIRALRANLQFLRNDPNGSQVLLFTSSISGEGKSFLSLNLGASLALVGRPTVILELDMRKPQLSKGLNIHASKGLSSYLIGEATVDEILQPIEGYDNYYLMNCGPQPPNPSELLSSPRLEQLFKELRERFSYVIVDSPPIGLVADAQLIAPYADATLFMVRHDVTPKNYVKMINTIYKEQRFHRLHLVLNAVGAGEAYHYGYSYGNYYSNNLIDK